MLWSSLTCQWNRGNIPKRLIVENERLDRERIVWEFVVQTKLLDEDEFRATFVDPIQRIDDGGPIVDFWPYVDAVEAADFEGHDCSDGSVGWVYRMADRYEHVGICSQTPNVFMTIVLDLHARRVHGHRLMNFNTLYGLQTPQDGE